MKHWFVTVILLFTYNAIGQTEDLDASQKGFSNLTQAGKLFQVEVRPADKHLHLFLSGVSSGEVKLNEATVEASIGVGEGRKTIVAKKTKDPKTGRFYYKIKKQGKKPFKLKIRSGDLSEELSFPPPN